VIFLEKEPEEKWHRENGANMHQDGSEMWIGGLVEEYGNNWGFRFKPGTINVAEITAEGAQTWIADISENTNYWMNTWSKKTYVFARVTEIHA